MGIVGDVIGGSAIGAVECSFFYYFALDIKKQIKEKKELDEKNIIKKLIDFIMLDDEHCVFRFVLINGFKGNMKQNEKDPCKKAFEILFKTFEYLGNFSPIKYLFPLIDELKKSFENPIYKIQQILKNKEEFELLEKKCSDSFKSLMENANNEELNKYVNFLNEKNDNYYLALSGIAFGLINIIIYGNLNQISVKEFFGGIFF